MLMGMAQFQGATAEHDLAKKLKKRLLRRAITPKGHLSIEKTD
jgi:hypothetical protein